MITREQIRRIAGYSFYRGEELYRQRKIRKFEVKRNGEQDTITADVRGSGGNVYDVSITLERDTGLVEESWCDCPAFYSYEGMCKHCTAVLLKYMSEPDMTADGRKSLADYLDGLDGTDTELQEG